MVVEWVILDTEGMFVGTNDVDVLFVCCLLITHGRFSMGQQMMVDSSKQRRRCSKIDVAVLVDRTYAMGI
jgi:hypothetical protein